jgi:hypothetical protein
MWRVLLPLVMTLAKVNHSSVKSQKRLIRIGKDNDVDAETKVETKAEATAEALVEPVGDDCTGDKVEVTTQTIKSKDEVFEVDLQIPEISCIKDSTLQNRINSQFNSDALAFRKETEVYVSAYVREAEKNAIPINPCIAKTEYKVHYNSNNILSISVKYYSYTGGVHGSTVIKTLNINVDTGKILYLSDFYGSNYEEIVLQAIHSQIENNEDKYYKNARENLNSIPEKQSFYLLKGYVVVYYGEYDIAPYASGIPEFRIPIAVMPY